MLLLAVACSHPSSTGQAAPRGHIESLTITEIDQSGNFSNVYDMLAQLRARWLEPPRGTDAIHQKLGEIMVRLNDTEFGPVESLRGFYPARITAIRFFDSVSARERWGVDYPRGAIAITTRSMRQ